MRDGSALPGVLILHPGSAIKIHRNQGHAGRTNLSPMEIREVCLGPKLMKCSLGKELDVASVPQRIVMLIPTIREGQQQISKVTSVVGSAADN